MNLLSSQLWKTSFFVSHKTNKAIGLDNFSARLLKDSATIISASLTRLFNLSLETHIFPSLWKFGKVTELFKKGDRCDANNYRPITVLPTICKILEKAVHIQLYAYQFGFRPKLSTGTTLAYFTDNILQNMEAGSFAGAVFLDLSKAFDTMDHHLLLRKLTNIGLTNDYFIYMKFIYLYCGEKIIFRDPRS